MKSILFILFLSIIIFKNSSAQSLGPLFDKQEGPYILFNIEKVTNGNNHQYARWETGGFRTVGESCYEFRGIMTKSDFEFFKSKFTGDKLYKPEVFWNEIKDHLGPKTDITSPYWEKIQFDNIKKTGYYKVKIQ